MLTTLRRKIQERIQDDLPKSEDVSPNKIVWQPIPNTSQSFALDSRCHSTLYHGTRGVGKTAIQLMSFRKHVGLGYGKFWRGVIFDREFKNLADIVMQSKRFFEAFDDGAKFLSSASEYKWVWPTGEELLFRHAKKLEDYEAFHGHEYCLAEGSLVQTRFGQKEIQNLKIGDRVATANGFKSVTRCFNLGLKDCLKAEVYTLDGQLRSSQLQSVSHRLLTIEQGYSTGQSQKSHIVPQFCEKLNLQEAILKFLDDERLNNSAASFLQECEGSDAILFDKLRRKILVSLSYLQEKVQLSTRFQNTPAIRQQISILCRNASEFFELLQERTEDSISLSICCQQLLELVRLSFHLEACYSHARLIDDSVALHIALNFLSRCFFYRRLCDVLARTDRETALLIAQQLRDVPANTRRSSSDVSANEVEYNRLYRFVFWHPYQMDKLICSSPRYSWAYVEYSSCGKLPCYDITVEEVNHYLTCNGLVNKNCFIGFNELTKHASGDLYYKILSTNRSGFLPLEHTPHDVVAANTPGAIEGLDRIWRKYHTSNGKPLPPIPLRVFNTTNPSGRGRAWVKRDMIDVAEAGEVVRTRVQVYNPQTREDEWVEMTHVHIFGSWRENRFIDPKYVAWLKSIKEKNLRRAWLLGDWSVTAGGAIDDLWQDDVHILPANFVPPKQWKIDRAFDWGSSTPACCIWFAESNGEEARLSDGRIFCPPAGTLVAFREWYICAKDDITGKPMIGKNKGAKISPTAIAKGIKTREIEWMNRKLMLSQPKAGPADNQIRNVSDVSNETIEAKMKAEGIKWIESDKSPGTNAMGLQVIRDRLEAACTGEGKALYVTRDCPATIELVPPIPLDEEKLDEPEREYENHAYDVIKYRCLAGNKNTQGKINIKPF